MVALSDYKTSVFVSLADVKNPIRKKIAGLEKGKWDKPNLIFSDGKRLSLNATNRKVLLAEVGDTEDELIGSVVELYHGEFDTQKGKEPGVALRPVGTDDPFDDEIPFNK